MKYRILTERLHHIAAVGEIVSLSEGVNIDALVASGAVELVSDVVESPLEEQKPAKNKSKKASKE